MKIAVMQPYVFPYIGYFQLINSVHTFIFYDDVNFIKKGYINKNHLLHNQQKWAFTISCKKISQNKKINETELDFNANDRIKLVNSLKHSYKKAPFFDVVFPLLHDFFMSYNKPYISQMAMDSIVLVADYLNVNTAFEISSERFGSSQALKKADRLIDICQQLDATEYINSFGGVELYDKAYFSKNNIHLHFLKSKPVAYKQFDNDFVPWLSIIDVMMFNSVEQIKNMIEEYDLI